MQLRTLAKELFGEKKIVILGLARQGIALARFFTESDANVIVSDAASQKELSAEIAAIADLPLTLALGGHPESLLDGCDLLCLSGGVSPQIAFVESAIERGIPLTNDSLLTLQMASAVGLGPTIAITGSSGKTTTTTLVGEMLTESDKTVHVGGNIGRPLIDQLENFLPGEPIVLELSSFQLELFDPEIAWSNAEWQGPDVAAILNVTPNHLDRHPSMAAYVDAKLNLLRQLPATAMVILNADDAVTARIGMMTGSNPQLPQLPPEWQLDGQIVELQKELTQQEAQILFFGRQRVQENAAWSDGNMLILAGAPICSKVDLRLRGEHNVGNVLAAAAISSAAGAGLDAICTVARRFQGVDHRLEVVAEENGISWINDSIATSPERALMGLRSFEGNDSTLIFLVGGKDKNLSWDSLADAVISAVDFVIGFGDAGSGFVDMVQERAQFAQVNAPSSAVVQQLDGAVDLAMRVATSSVNAHDDDGNAADKSATDKKVVVLLSPGGTSFDAYKDFAERGEHFRHLVKAQLQTERVIDIKRVA